jgi:hypothetical protein
MDTMRNIHRSMSDGELKGARGETVDSETHMRQCMDVWALWGFVVDLSPSSISFWLAQDEGRLELRWRWVGYILLHQFCFGIAGCSALWDHFSYVSCGMWCRIYVQGLGGRVQRCQAELLSFFGYLLFMSCFR